MAIGVSLIGTRGVGGSPIATVAGTSTGGTGNHGLLLMSYDPSSSVSGTITDSKGNTFSLQGSVLTNFGRQVAYTALNWTGGASHNVSVAFTGTPAGVAHLLEVTGAESVSPIDIDTSATDTARPVQITHTTLSQSNELIIVFCEDNDLAGTLDYTSPDLTGVLSSEPDVSLYWTSGVGYKIVSSTAGATYQLQRQAAGSSSSIIRLLSFKESAGGGGGGDISLMGQICL
jgi:hypothetical protein